MSNRIGLSESAHKNAGAGETLPAERRAQSGHARVPIVSSDPEATATAPLHGGRLARPRRRGPGLRTAFVILLVVPGLFAIIALPHQGASPAAAGSTRALDVSGAQSLTVSAGARPDFERDLYSATSMEELLAARAAAAAAAAEAAAAAAVEAALAATESAKFETHSEKRDDTKSSSESYSDPDDIELAAFLVDRSLAWSRPIDAPVSSPYGPRRIICNPAGCSNAFHDGVDFGASCGAPVAAVAAGRVVFAGRAGAYGNRVIVDHGRGIESIYGHIEDDSYAVTVGDLIEAGTTVGDVGVTGVATGCHLDLKIRVDGEYLSPVAYLTARGVPL